VIENILPFIADMEKTFGDQIDIDFDSIVNMDPENDYEQQRLINRKVK
jgi:hypothetical protein